MEHRRPRPERPPLRTDLPYEYEIVDFLDGRVEPGISCSSFEFTVLTESLEAKIGVGRLQKSTSGSWVLSTGHVINNIYYVVHPYSFRDLCRNVYGVMFESREGKPRHRVDIFLSLIDCVA
jgi:hypothetical protein